MIKTSNPLIDKQTCFKELFVVTTSTHDQKKGQFWRSTGVGKDAET